MHKFLAISNHPESQIDQLLDFLKNTFHIEHDVFKNVFQSKYTLNNFDLIFIDYIHGDITKLELHRQLRSLQIASFQAPIIILKGQNNCINYETNILDQYHILDVPININDLHKILARANYQVSNIFKSNYLAG